MTIKCAWASIDERGKASGGKIGDQTGKEVKVGDWYAFGQNVIIRPRFESDANEIASAVTYWAKKNYVGYDQGNRTSLYDYLRKRSFDYRSVNNPVETDCSAMVAAAINCAGIKISGNAWTGNLKECCKATGKFIILEDSKYMVSDRYLKRGDIVLNEAAHVIVALEDGINANKKRYTGLLPTSIVNKKVGNRNNIKRWQMFLNWYYSSANLKIDGSFGPLTTSWTEKFQKEMGLIVDGSCGPKTLGAAKTVRK